LYTKHTDINFKQAHKICHDNIRVTTIKVSGNFFATLCTALCSYGKSLSKQSSQTRITHVATTRHLLYHWSDSQIY